MHRAEAKLPGHAHGFLALLARSDAELAPAVRRHEARSGLHGKRTPGTRALPAAVAYIGNTGGERRVNASVDRPILKIENHLHMIFYSRDDGMTSLIIVIFQILDTYTSM